MKKRLAKKICLLSIIIVVAIAFPVGVLAEEKNIEEIIPLENRLVTEATNEIISTDLNESIQIMGNTPNLSNTGYKSPTNPLTKAGYGGQCTAFVWGRSYEKMGKSLPFIHYAFSFWQENNVNRYFPTGDANSPRSNSIAVWSDGGTGHVAFVEEVNGDTVYFNEANWDTFKDTNYGGGYDGSLKSSSKAGMKVRGRFILQGYIYLEDVDTVPPKITNLQFTDINTEGFTVTCNVEDDASGIKQVDFPIWTEINGQDEVVWYPGTIEGNEATCRVKFSEHNNEKGYYRVNVWAYDKKGLCSKLEGNGLDINSSPSITINSFETSRTTGQEINTSINLTVEVSGGVMPYRYKFYAILGTTTIDIQDYSSKNIATFKPTVAGTYTLFVEVKDDAGKIVSRTIENYLIKETGTEHINNVTCSYRTHVQNEGWQTLKYNGDMSGTSGKSYRLEGIEVNLKNQGYDLGVAYSTHVENIGWQEIRSNGVMSGTSGKGLRLEAIKINLTGADANKFDIYYQVHAQNFGWLDWAKNGAESGTAGYGYRLEGIRIQVVPKGDPAPGVITRPFVQN